MQQRLVDPSVSALALVLCWATSLQAQQGALYPGRDLPGEFTPPATQFDIANSSDADAPATAAARLPQSASDAFDWRHLTPTPNDMVRDLDGDGHLDGIQLLDGITTWRGFGDGRFAEPVFVPTLKLGTSPLLGRQADVNGDGLLDVVFVAQHFTPTYSVVDHILAQPDGSFVHAEATPTPLPIEIAVQEYEVAYMDDDEWPDLVGRKGYTYPGATLSIVHGTGTTTYAQPVDVATPPGFIGRPAVGDLDGDGLLDVAVVVGNIFNGIQTYTQAPHNAFVLGSSHDLQANFSTSSLSDVDGDGFLDMVVETPTGYRFFLGHGDGTLDATSLPIPDAGRFLHFVDVDQDGLVDIVSRRNASPYGLHVSLVDADGSLGAPIDAPHFADPLGFGDFDEDGILDAWTVQVPLLGVGDGSFSTPRSFDIGVRVKGPSGIALADLDGNGRDDVIAIDDANTAAAVFDLGAATFSDPVPFDLDLKVRTVAAADLDGDGDVDVVMGDLFGAYAELFVNQGDGSFVPGTDVAVGGLLGKTGMVFGRFDNDAKPDLAVVGDGLLTVRKGNGDLTFGPLIETPLPANPSTPWLIARDATGDGVDDLFLVHKHLYFYRCLTHDQFAAPVLVASNASGVGLGDIDGNGTLDVVTLTGSIVSFALGDGNGGFTSMPAWTFDAGYTMHAAAIGDADGDGTADLALGGDYAWSLHLGLPGNGVDPVAVDRFDVTGGAWVMRFDDPNADGALDLLAYGSTAAANNAQVGYGINVSLNTRGPWDDVGFSLANSEGRRPFLLPTGPLVDDSQFGLQVVRAVPLSTAHLVLGLDALFAPLKGGVLVPTPLVVLSGLPTDGDGTLALSAAWPNGTPSDVALWMQVWIQDASGPLGLTATNGVVGTTP